MSLLVWQLFWVFGVVWARCGWCWEGLWLVGDFLCSGFEVIAIVYLHISIYIIFNCFGSLHHYML